MKTLSKEQHEERRRQREFAMEHAEPEYRTPLQRLHQDWTDWNVTHFGGKLVEPHIGFGRTAPRSLGHCSPTTKYGGRLDITLNEGLFFGPNRDWIIHPLPAEGASRFVEDLLLRFTVRQYVLEVEGTDEPGYRGFGPVFTREANRIGLALLLPPVTARHRPTGDPDEPLASGWPHCVRPPGYYGDDVTEQAIDLAVGGHGARGGRASPPSMGAWELLRFLFHAGRPATARAVVDRQVTWLREWEARRRPVLGRVEDGKEDLDGSPLGVVTFQAAWLAWNDGTVGKMAEAIRRFRAFYEMPLLADALEEAGCDEPRILRHLRTNRTEHTSRCWVLRGLAAAAAGRDGLRVV